MKRSRMALVRPAGQGGYNNDSNHDAVVDGTTPDTEEQFTEEVAGWATKRDRGETYVMGTGTWSEQMDAFQQLFVGKPAFGKGFARHLKQNAVDFADQLVTVGRLKVKLSGHGLDD